MVNRATLEAARRAQESVMFDRVRIDRVTVTVDRATGTETETPVLVWEGQARLPRRDSSLRVIVAGETTTPADTMVLVPHHVRGIRPDDRVTVTDSLSGEMVGRVLWVTDSSPRTFQSAQHLTCRETR